MNQHQANMAGFDALIAKVNGRFRHEPAPDYVDEEMHEVNCPNPARYCKCEHHQTEREWRQ